ncbi:MAG TPA: chromosomal replication initiator protein DnaA [Firmicutes bacterium]|nr:chromosomal replication initiator protein DnaA [Candidatus Fermentithermobacillaceae bacterium]
MEKSLEELWNDALSKAAVRFSNPGLIQSWLKDTRPAGLSNNVLTITVPSEFAKNWIEARYREELTRAWQETSGWTCQLKFTVAQQEKLVPETLFPAEGYASPIRKRKTQDEASFQVKNLNPRYVFENFIVGASNRFAHAAALAVAESPSKIYNPLFIYGGVGLGKTHLMQAIAHYVLSHHKGLKVSYVSSETFTNELILAIQEGNTQQFRNRYRGVDLLLIDDIQFVAGKDATQEEFFHTFDALHQESKQIVISSDRPPKEISTLEERLRTRFEWGLICDIQPPDIETRIAILRKKAELEGRSVPLEVCQYIAEKIPTNIRELEGALIRVLAYTALQKREVTLEITKEVLRGLLPEKKEVPVTIDSIKKAVAEFYNIDISDFNAKRRTRNIAYPRQVAMYLCRILTDSSLPQIGQQFGGRDHTTVLHACAKVEADRKENPAFEESIQKLIKRIKEG